jgi:hypothetical protein
MSNRATLIWIRDPVKLPGTISSIRRDRYLGRVFDLSATRKLRRNRCFGHELCDASARIESRVCLRSVAGKRLSRQVHVIDPHSSASLHHQVQPNQIRLLSRLEEKRSHGRHPTHGARNWTIQPT